MSEEVEIIGYAREHNTLQIHTLIRYGPDYSHAEQRDVSDMYLPARPDGSDRDGDFWNDRGICVGKFPHAIMSTKFEPTPEETLAGTYPHVGAADVLKLLVEQGRITEDEIIGAKAAARLLGLAIGQTVPPPA